MNLEGSKERRKIMLTKSIPLFTLFGFKVKMDLSWIVIGLLLLWTLAGAFFPMLYPELTTGIYIGMAVLGVAGLVISVVVHEFSHAIVGRHYGLPIGGITLFIFGGIAEMKDEPANPKVEFWMAIAGPIASLGIAGISFLLYSASINLQWPIVIAGVLNYLWQINLILAIFNMIPAFPLDGGRVLRSALWKWKGQLQWATGVSASIGVGFGFLLMILGVLAFFAGNPIGGLWYFFIGIFIRMIAQSSYQSIVIRNSIKGQKIDEFVNHRPIFVLPETRIDELVNDYILQHHHKMFPVVVGDRLVGCVSTHQISTVDRGQWGNVRVADIMRPCEEENTVQTGTDIQNILPQISGRPSARLLVLDGNRLVGIVNTNDLLKWISIKMELAENDQSDNSEQDRPNKRSNKRVNKWPETG